jgi:transposase
MREIANMAGKSRLLDARVVSIAKKELKKLGQYGYVSRKLHAVIAASRHSIAEVAKVYDISRTTLISWIKHISESGVEQLKAPPGRHRKTKLSTSQLETVDSFIIDDPNITIRALRAKIEETFGVLLGKSTVHRIMRQKYSHITPRPKHYQQDRSQVEEFKKKHEGDA